MKIYVNYFLIIIGFVLIFANFYMSQFQIDKENVWRIIGTVFIISLGIVNIINQRKNENRRI